MAGRVEEIINNKFYFVLDEVGASDCESELGSENEPKEAADRSLKINLTDKNNSDSTNASNDNNVGNEIKNKNIQHPTISKNNQNCFIEDKASVEKLEEKSNVDTNQMCSHSPQSVTVIDLASEETSTVVDMDIDSEGEYNENEIEPLLRITFRDHSIEKFFKPALTKFFTQKMEDCALVTSNKNKLELEVYEKDSVQLLEDDVVSFDLDTTPTQGSHGEVPHYGKAHNFVLSDKIQKEENNSKLFAAPKLTCFNCLKSHNLKDCKKNKDFRTISRNRIKFQNLMKMAKTSRYHLDEGQKFNSLVPGVLSKKLRNALNLNSDQQPSFIYRMRLLGYPPAWLEEAKVSHSGVAMYDSTGIPVLEDDEEEGEIVPEGSKDKFDISKIIEFPGFNVPLPSNFKDEAKMYGCPDMSEEQSKQALIKLLTPKTVQAYVKKSITTKSSDQSKDKSKRLPSPTIEEMEEKKRQLLMELDDVESASIPKLNSEDSSSGTGTEVEMTQNAPAKEPGSVMNSKFGTPILKSVSPFSKLPSREQFCVDMSDILNFENLPNSTGKYETIRHVITKIRISASKSENK